MPPPDDRFYGHFASGYLAKVCAFSLLELLVVIAIFSVLVTMTGPMVASIAEGRSTYRAAEVISNAAALARQTAVTSGREVAMIVSKESGFDKSQAVLLLSAPLSSGGIWVPQGAWTKLPSVVRLEVFDRDDVKSFYERGGGILQEKLPVKLDGEEIADYAYIVFCANGSVSAPATGPAVTLRRLNRPAASPDYTVIVQSESGRVKMIAN